MHEQTINIMFHDIMGGKSVDPCGCPIASAINRTLPKDCYCIVADRIKVMQARTEHRHAEKIADIQTPMKAQEFIREFDREVNFDLPGEPSSIFQRTMLAMKYRGFSFTITKH